MLRRAIGHKSRGPPQYCVIVTRGSTAGPKSTREFIRAKVESGLEVGARM